MKINENRKFKIFGKVGRLCGAGGRAEVNVIFEIQHTTAKEITNLADGIKYSVPPMPAPEILIKAGSNFTVTAPPVFDNALQKWIIKVTQTQ